MVQLTLTIPTYNRRATVARLAEQIANQMTAGDELIVSDDASTDGTLEALGKVPSVEVVRHATSLGMVGNWNFCLTAGRNEWVCLIHDDDELMPGALEAVRRVCTLAGRPALIAHAEWENLPQYSEPALAYRFRDAGAGAALQAEFCPSGVTIHRAIPAALGGFSSAFAYSADMEYFARVCAAFDSYVIERPRIVRYVRHDDNHQIRTWQKTDFPEQLRRVESESVAAAKLDAASAERILHDRLKRDLLHMIRTVARLGNAQEVRRWCKLLSGEPYFRTLNLRTRTAVRSGALLGRLPARLL